MWEKVNSASQNDLPKTALEYVKQIRMKAANENNDAQLFRAVLMERIYGGEISPDSATRVISQMEKAVQKEEQPVVKQLWHSALAQVYSSQLRWWNDNEVTTESLLKKSRSHFKASLTNLEALASARVTDYLPIFEEGNESRFFNNDVLHILFNAYRENLNFLQEDNDSLFSVVRNFYQRTNNQEAVLLLSLDSLKQISQSWVVKETIENDELYKNYIFLAKRYANSELLLRVYEAMIEMQDLYDSESIYAQHNDSILLTVARCGKDLKNTGTSKNETNAFHNFISRLEQPRAELKHIADAYMPNQTVSLTLKTRNLRQIKLRITKIGDNRAEYDKLTNQDVLKKVATLRKKAQVLSYDIPSAPAWSWHEQEELFISPSDQGIYCLELLFDNKVYDYKIFSVSTLHPLVFSSQNRPSRIIVVDAESGLPIPNIKITAYSNNGKNQIKSYTTDVDGSLEINNLSENRNYIYYASSATDKASLAFRIRGYGYSQRLGRNSKQAETNINLFTDRAIYRPGQTVYFSGTVFTHCGDDFRVDENYEAKITLYNVNRKVVDTLLVRSNQFGSFAGSFVLPSTTLPGRFLLEAEGQSKRCTLSFKVEEYKRPTFTIETFSVKDSYTLLDTVKVEGIAQTYSGVPLVGAKVKYNVRRGSWFVSSANREIQTGETITDEKGKFCIPVYLFANEAERVPNECNWFHYLTSYTVTAENGETIQGSTSLSAAAWKTRIQFEVPSIICKENLPTFTVREVNASNENILLEGEYRIKRVGENDSEKNGCMVEGSFRTDSAFTIEKLKALPSGKYEMNVRTSSNNPTKTVEFILFSEKNTKPIPSTNAFFTYSRENNSKDSVFVMIGTTANEGLVFYDLLANDELVESKRILLSDSIFHLNLSYKPEYGDGAKAFFAYVKSDTLHTFEVQVTKPKPNKNLQLRWSSFRSRLIHGQAEEWHLKVVNPDNTPANAMVMAGMYDSSLDSFAKNIWNFDGVYFSRILPYANWSWTNNNNKWNSELSGAKDYKTLPIPSRIFSHWRNDFFNAYFSASSSISSRKLLRATSNRITSLDGAAMEEAMIVAESKQMNAANKSDNYKLEAAIEDADTESASGETDNSVNLRTNFAETAFFLPLLQTNEQGEVCIAFTLPESMTTWNFSALAHDETMNNGRLDTTLVARKEFMVEPALPRFVRYGNKTYLPVKVTNLSASSITANLVLSLADASNEDLCLLKKQQSITLSAGESNVYNFPYEVKTGAPLLVCRVVAQNEKYADGEEHYLPVLSNLTEVVRTLPFSMTEKGSYSFQIDTLFNRQEATNRSLTVEMSSHPLWYVVSALPTLVGSESCLSSTEWATRYYALALSSYIAQKKPEIRDFVENSAEEREELTEIKTENLTDETPWLQHREKGKQRGQALKNLFNDEWNALKKFTALDKLGDLQNSNGSWSWYKGMSGSPYITLEVVLMLSRVKVLTGDADAEKLLQKAFSYLEEEIGKQVEEMKIEEKKSKTLQKPSSWQLRYIYLRTLLAQKIDDDTNFLLDRAEKMRKELSMYEKAISALVFAKANRKDVAQLNFESLLQHTVSTTEMGRYFDTPRAAYSWNSYRIPTQCAAIETADFFSEKEVASSMRLWLLQSKRTQMWETSCATSDAIYSLLTAPSDTTLIGQLNDKTPLYYTLKKGNDIVGLNAQSEGQAKNSVNYFKQTYSEKPAIDATQFLVKKSTDGLAWGSLYATFTIPDSLVKTEGRGLTVKSYLEVQRKGQWIPLVSTLPLQKGDKVRQVFTIKADRDFDFVALTSPRAACFESVRALSGYQNKGDLSAYCAVHDTQTQYFIEKIHKGTHLFAEEFLVDRLGIYSTGTVKIQCVFAPEFQGASLGFSTIQVVDIE